MLLACTRVSGCSRPSACSHAEYARRINRDPVHKAPELLKESVYGLTELHRSEIKKARVVALVPFTATQVR